MTRSDAPGGTGAVGVGARPGGGVGIAACLGCLPLTPMAEGVVDVIHIRFDPR